MAGLQRSVTSFRRQGSSGLVWEDKYLSGELNKPKGKEDGAGAQNRKQEIQEEAAKELAKPAEADGSINTIERSRSNGGGRGYRTGKVSPAIEPPSPRFSECGFCRAFRKKEKTRRRRAQVR